MIWKNRFEVFFATYSASFFTVLGGVGAPFCPPSGLKGTAPRRKFSSLKGGGGKFLLGPAMLFHLLKPCFCPFLGSDMCVGGPPNRKYTARKLDCRRMCFPATGGSA